MDHEFERMLPKDAASIAAGIRFHHKISTDLLAKSTSPIDFIQRLMAADCDSDAIRFLAQAMPIRESIWWGLLCVWRVFGPTPEEKEVWAIQAAVNWVTDPSETRRRAASSAAHAVGNNTAPGCLTNAVFWSGGSIGKVGMPTVQAPETSAAKAVGGAILLAAAKVKKAPKCREFRREFILLGLEVARGKNLWNTPTSTKEASVNEHSAPHAEEEVVAST
ncbi:hypothetical protein K2Y11_02405 [bacterium]|nr:hypothetical protein [bacterium]